MSRQVVRFLYLHHSSIRPPFPSRLPRCFGVSKAPSSDSSFLPRLASFQSARGPISARQVRRRPIRSREVAHEKSDISTERRKAISGIRRAGERRNRIISISPTATRRARASPQASSSPSWSSASEKSPKLPTSEAETSVPSPQNHAVQSHVRILEGPGRRRLRLLHDGFGRGKAGGHGHSHRDRPRHHILMVSYQNLPLLQFRDLIFRDLFTASV